MVILLCCHCQISLQWKMQNYYYPFSSFGTSSVAFCLCNAIAMFCLHFKRFAIKIHTAFKQIHTKFKLKFTMVSYLTLQMHGSAVPQPCKCKVSEFPWKLANARVSMTDLTYSYKGNKTYIHTLLLYNQACSFNRKRLEQIFTLLTKHLFNFYCHGAHNRTSFYQT